MVLIILRTRYSIGELPGCGGSGAEKKGAAIKTFCRFELLSGNFSELIFDAGKTADCKLEERAKPLPAKALHLTDMGFFDAERLRREDEQGVCWITRIPSGTLLEIDDVRQSIGTFLSTRTESRVDVPAFLCGNRLPIRFVALRAPTSVVRQRLERLQKEARRKGRTVSREQRNLCRWTVFATNIPSSLYTADEIYTLYRVRWQIELVFKLWKSEGGVATGHGRTGDRCLCEFLAKVLGQMIANWLMLLRCGRLGEASSVLLYRRVCLSLPSISESLWSGDVEGLRRVIGELCTRLDRLRPRKKRKKQPSTRQTLCEHYTYD